MIGVARTPFLAMLLLAASGVSSASAQIPRQAEVRQLVTFSFLPGRSTEAVDLFRTRAIPLYMQDDAMLSFRGFREVESPIALDLVVVSAFNGMAGMDDSNARLRELAEESGSSIGALYGQIGSLSSAHTDQFVEMLPALGSGDPSAPRLTAFVWYRVLPGRAEEFEAVLEESVARFESDRGLPSATGRFLVSDGWDYLRFVGFDSLGEYHAYWSELGAEPWGDTIDELTLERREVILSSVPALAVR